jgi:plasmid maintenance system antidote protein VapI
MALRIEKAFGPKKDTLMGMQSASTSSKRAGAHARSSAE